MLFGYQAADAVTTPSGPLAIDGLLTTRRDHTSFDAIQGAK
jgi:hypothetical protein